MHLCRLPLLVVVAVVFTQCETFTKGQKDRLTAIQVTAAPAGPNLWVKPSFVDPVTKSKLNDMAFGVGGVVPLLLTAAIVNSREAALAKRQHADIEAVNRAAPPDMGEVVRRQLEASLRADEFYGPRLVAANGASEVSVKVITQTLQPVRHAAHLHTPLMVAEMTIRDRRGKVLRRLHRFVTAAPLKSATGPVPAAAPIDNYGRDPALLAAHTEVAARKLGEIFANELRVLGGTKKRTGPGPGLFDS